MPVPRPMPPNERKHRQLLLDLFGPEEAKRRLREDRERAQRFREEYRETRRREQAREAAEMLGDTPDLDEEHGTE